MTRIPNGSGELLRWTPGSVVLTLAIDAGSPVRVLALTPQGSAAPPPPPAGPGVPLVEVDCLGAGRSGNSAADQHRPYTVSLGLRLDGHSVHATALGECLQVRQSDTERGLCVLTRLQHVGGTAVVRVEHEITNVGAAEVVLSYVSTLSLCGFAGSLAPWENLTLHAADNAWCAELRWQHRSLADAGLVDNGEVGEDEGNATSRGRYAVAASGSWSSGGKLPMGAIERAEPATAWVWQIEHPGSWLWEVGDLRQDLYLLASGPTDREHQWRHRLAPGVTFTTVPAAVAVTPGGLTDGLRQLTAYRRLIRRPSADNERLPVIFNDYMNCLMGDPSETALAPLIAAAAEVGCEYFVIDAGWYADDRGWWDTVGEWQPSAVRFPSGLDLTMARIRDAGMAPGLWLEPEVVGVRSAAADLLPDDAFFRRGGRRVAENGRFHLDFRCAAVRTYLDSVVDRLVGEYGVGYFKLDYNICLPGTDGPAGGRGEAPGAGLLGHNRAYLDWLDGVLDRHPGLVLENCASGGMRMDYALLSRLSLQSTSDQRDHRRYAAIAAAAPSGVTPEQAAVWAYPQPEHSPEEATFCLVNALLGRVHLSGRPDAMSAPQRDRVREALTVYKGHRALLATGLPHWPLGLPGWSDQWLALAIADPHTSLLALWCRDPAGGTISMRLPWLAPESPAPESPAVEGPAPEGRTADGWRVAPVFPTDLPTTLAWSAESATIRITLPAGPAARLLRFTR